MSNYQFITYWDTVKKTSKTMLLNLDQIVYIEEVDYDIGKYGTYYFIGYNYNSNYTGCYVTKNEAYRIMKIMGISSPEI